MRVRLDSHAQRAIVVGHALAMSCLTRACSISPERVPSVPARPLGFSSEFISHLHLY